MNDCARKSFFRTILILAILALTPSGHALQAQGQVREVVVPEGGVDVTSFPTVSARAIVSSDTRARVAGLSEADFTLTEDGEELPFALDEVEVGVQVVFVLDASLSVRQAGATGYTRLEEAKQVIYNFAQQHMQEGVDQVAVLAPESSTTYQRIAPLPDDPSDFTTFVNTVHDGTYLYELPEDISATPLNDMVSKAINMVAGSQSGMHRAIVVISDGVDVISDRQVADIVNGANQLNVPIYTVIFGPANNWGGAAEANMKRLSLDTYGEHFQLAGETQKPTPIEELIEQGMATLYANLTGQRTQYRLTYTSQIAAPGVHGIGIAVGTKSTRTSLSLNIKPPQVSLDQPSAGQLITRQTDDPALSLQDIEPRTQTVGFQVSFPDGYQRDVAAVELLVDGVAVLDTCSPPCTEITWNLAALPAGAHSLRLRVRDQQGLEAVSNEVPVTISIITPTPIPPPSPTPIVLPTPVPPPLSCEERYSGMNRLLQCNQQIFGLGALLVSVGALLLAFVVIRRPPQVVSTVARRVKDATIPFRAIQAQPGAPPAGKATLEVLEGDESHSKPIDLIAESTRMGRDEELVQVVFQNRSVSRLHARIAVETDRQGNVRYVLYDEGSTSGTYVNMQSVGIKGQELNDGDTIHLGPVRLRFTLKGKKPVVARDDTIPSIPVPPKTAAPVEDEFATSPYVPAQPGPAPAPAIDATQPFTASGSPATPEGPDVYMEEEEEVSTEPYVPMDFSDE